MKHLGLPILLALLAATCFAQKYNCMPADIREGTVASFRAEPSAKTGQAESPVTIGQTLKTLKARCSRGKLIDRRGKQIRFYQLDGCWGNPPANYLEIMEKQRKDLKDMKRKYTVVELTCNASGLPVY